MRDALSFRTRAEGRLEVVETATRHYMALLRSPQQAGNVGELEAAAQAAEQHLANMKSFDDGAAGTQALAALTAAGKQLAHHARQRLLRLGVPVPDGFAPLVEAYRTSHLVAFSQRLGAPLSVWGLPWLAFMIARPIDRMLGTKPTVAFVFLGLGLVGLRWLGNQRKVLITPFGLHADTRTLPHAAIARAWTTERGVTVATHDGQEHHFRVKRGDELVRTLEAHGLKPTRVADSQGSR